MTDPAALPAALIAKLDLAPHPEGGWYRQTWAHPEPYGDGGRPLGTLILFLLETGQRSHWHRVDGVEAWLWHAGAPLWLGLAATDAGPVVEYRLGPDVLAGDTPQVVIPSGQWQAAEAREGWALVSCTVVPGFTFAGFTLAPPGWSPG